VFAVAGAGHGEPAAPTGYPTAAGDGDPQRLSAPGWPAGRVIESPAMRDRTPGGAAKRLIAGISALPVVVLALALMSGTAAAGGCVAGVHSYGGASARTFCGPASVSLHLGGKSYTLSGGQCARTSQYVSLNIGTIVLGNTSKPKPNYFGLDVGKTPGGGTPAPHDGTYKAFALAFVVGGKDYSSVNASVTLKGGRTRGSFSGKLLAGGSVSGTLNCG